MVTTKEPPGAKAVRPKAAEPAEVVSPGKGEATVPARPEPPTPFTFVRRFAEDMDRLFEEFGMGLGLRAPRLLSRTHELLKRETGMIPAAWSPQVDMFEREGNMIVRMDLPGLRKDDVTVEVVPGQLVIQGERKGQREEKEEGLYYTERQYGRFFRTIPLPEGVDVDHVSATFDRGELEVVMPVPPDRAKQPRKVEIVEGPAPAGT